MHSYDQAAWHATDRIQQDLSLAKLPADSPVLRSLRGYIVEPGDAGSLFVTFYGQRSDQYFAFARYAMSGSDVVSGGILEPDGETTLSTLALRMIAVRGKAIDAMQGPDQGLCSRSMPNTLILPPDAIHPMSVYILSSTTQNGHFPAGGHYRFDFDGDDKLVSQRSFAKSCIDINTEAKNGEKPMTFGITHFLDENPTEIHAFISYHVPVPLMVMTVRNRWLWSVEKGKIVPLEHMQKP